jgi:hypothetical protein
MGSPVPHSNAVHDMIVAYAADAADMTAKYLSRLRNSPEFQTIFKVSLATEAVLGAMKSRWLRPRPCSIRSITQQIPLLVLLGQLPVATRELRRVVELCFWTIYFSDHPIEWGSFMASPNLPVVRELETPISYCAHRDAVFYANYARERMGAEPSKIALTSINELRKLISERLNYAVHASEIASTGRKMPAFSTCSKQELMDFGTLYRQVCAHACIAICALDRWSFDRLQVMQRGLFDWLITRKTSKSIRAQEFGLRPKA